MPVTLVDGKGIAQAILANLKVQLDALPEPLHLAALCVGADPGLAAFVKIKQKAAQSIGVTFSSYFFDGKNVQEVQDVLKFLAADETVHGIFIELPLPANFNKSELIALIPPAKDVDALTAQSRVPAPAVLALQYVLIEHEIEVESKKYKVERLKAAVIGQGELVGRPVTEYLTQQGATVSTIDIMTPNPEAITKEADLVIACAGQPGLVTGQWIKEGAVVLDYGYSKHNAAFVGDVDLASVSKKASLLTPVPGGMGPLVVVAVLENLVRLALSWRSRRISTL